MKTLSIVLPAWNEEQNIARMVEAASTIARQVASEWEIIIVNDGSSDGTGQVCDDLAAANPNVRVVHHSVNRGYGIALRNGFAIARYELIFFTDSDAQFDLGELPQFLEYAGDFDIVAGYRANRQDPFYRLMNAKGWNLLVRLVLGIRIRDIDCAFKVFRREVFQRVQIRSVGSMVNTEIMAQVSAFGFSVKELAVTHLPRRFGNPTGASLHIIFKAFRDLFKLWRELRFIEKNQTGILRGRETPVFSRKETVIGFNTAGSPVAGR